jgi:hypothetical protein
MFVHQEEIMKQIAVIGLLVALVGVGLSFERVVVLESAYQET